MEFILYNIFYIMLFRLFFIKEIFVISIVIFFFRCVKINILGIEIFVLIYDLIYVKIYIFYLGFFWILYCLIVII